MGQQVAVLGRHLRLGEGSGGGGDGADHAGAASARPSFARFSPDFVWGAASSAFQLEGGAAEGGRGPSVWDQVLNSGAFGDISGDVAADHFHRCRDDVRLMAQLGLKAYRFSVSWTRVLPEGTGRVNEEGIRFYSDLIDDLLAHGIEPWVTIYHWDLPVKLNADFGGWLGDKGLMTDAFGSYARLLFQRLGDRVKRWVTVNEPWVSCMCYTHCWPSCRRGPGVDIYTAGYTQLLAHAEAVRIYREEFRDVQRGQIGLTLNADWPEPLDPSSPEDVEAAQRHLDFQLGWFADPLYFGDYPARMLETVGEDRLPRFSASESAVLKGSCDFFGVNFYYAKCASPLPPTAPASSAEEGSVVPDGGAGAEEGPSFTRDMSVRMTVPEDRGWELADNGHPVSPEGFASLLLYIQRRYSPPGGIAILENGFPAEPPESRAADAAAAPIRPRPFSATGAAEAIGVAGGDASAAPGAVIDAADLGGDSECRSPGAGIGEGARGGDVGGESNVAEDWACETFEDPRRERYLRSYLAALHSAKKAGADVRAYFVWSLLDNLEWYMGYSIRFGIVRVDFATQRRVVKRSGRFYSQVIKDGGLDLTDTSCRDDSHDSHQHAGGGNG